MSLITTVFASLGFIFMTAAILIYRPAKPGWKPSRLRVRSSWSLIGLSGAVVILAFIATGSGW